MDSIVTQGLLGLVFVLSIALWSRSGASAPQSGASAKKSNKKKKKSAATTSAKETVPASEAPSQLSRGTTSEAEAVRHDRPSVLAGAVEPSPSRGKSNGTGSKKAGKAASTKLTLAEFATKTNEERVEELERKARGDAGEKDLGRDMIDKDLSPEIPYKKVARIEPSLPIKRPVQTSVDEGWENVGGKGKIAPLPSLSKKTAESPAPNAWASSNPFALLPGSGAEVDRPNGRTLTLESTKAGQTSASNPSSKAKPGSNASLNDAQTKKQRQNAAKAQAKKIEKEAAEAERLARLAQHKKQLESERMKDFYKKQQPPASVPFSVQKETSNGARLAKASVNEKGALVWE